MGRSFFLLSVVSLLGPASTFATQFAVDPGTGAASSDASACITREAALSSHASFSATSVLESHSRYCGAPSSSSSPASPPAAPAGSGGGPKAFRGETLAYVTPWNSHGYDVAKIAAAKFSFVSPVWLQVRLDPSTGRPAVTGAHDVDRAWTAEVRSVCDPHRPDAPCPALVPRVAWEIPPANSGGSTAAAAVAAIVEAASEHDFDGIVLEAGLLSQAAFRANVVRPLGEALHARRRPARPSEPLLFIVVLPPNAAGRDGKLVSGLSSHDFAALAHSGAVDRFSLMTYDYSVHRGDGDGPNAPLPWVRESVSALVAAAGTSGDEKAFLASKILLGQPWYGYDHGEAITSGRYLELLRERRPRLRWEDKHAEHAFSYVQPGSRVKRTVHYPSLASVAARLALAEELGTGVSIWEIGQGLDYWLDLL
jgi:chitinase domain-containing protein 1